MAELIYPELSYKIVGLLFDVHTRLGGSFEEKYYQRAIEELLISNEVPFKRELKVDITINDKKIGKFFLDFLIDKRVVLELKAVPRLLPVHFRQIKTYLIANKLKLGILANFRGEKLIYKRILNSKVDVY